MCEDEQRLNESEREAAEDKTRRPDGRTPDHQQEVPLFLRDISDGWKGNAQDEKDGIGE